MAARSALTTTSAGRIGAPRKIARRRRRIRFRATAPPAPVPTAKPNLATPRAGWGSAQTVKPSRRARRPRLKTAANWLRLDSEVWDLIACAVRQTTGRGP
jgi:hypothetical protein